MGIRNLTIDDIESIIQHGESRTLEVKESTGEIAKGLASACAFLNSDGGWLLFGITPQMRIVGQNVSDTTRQDIANHLKKIEPSVDVAVQYVELKDKKGFHVVAIYFDPNSFSNAPYTYDGRAYYKSESTTLLMPRQMYEERLRISNPTRFSWENRPNADISIDDLDENQVYLTLQEGVHNRRIHASVIKSSGVKDVLTKLNLANKDGVLLNASNVLFGKDPMQHHIHCKLRLARFEGTDKRVFRDQTVCDGNLFDQYDEAISFCQKHLMMGGQNELQDAH